MRLPYIHEIVVVAFSVLGAACGQTTADPGARNIANPPRGGPANEVTREPPTPEQNEMSVLVRRIDAPSWANEPTHNILDSAAWHWFQARMPAIEQAIQERLVEYVNDPQIFSVGPEGYPNYQQFSGEYYLSDVSVRVRPQTASQRELWILTIIVECLQNSDDGQSRQYVGWEAGIYYHPAADEWELDAFEQRAR